jgi:hypothetical protein
MLFNGHELTIEYRDICDNKLLLSESFTPRADGTLTHTTTPAENTPLRTGLELDAS